MASPPLQMQFVTSADKLEALPASDAEVAVVGRSNVGKSSLLNAIANRKELARTSKTPGRTQLLNCFSLPGGGTVVDCPGYGYAKTPRSVREAFGPMIEHYLLERENLRMVAILVDGEIGPTKLDTQMLDWVRSCDIPHSVIATKHDKVKSSKRDTRKKDLANKCELDKGDVLWVSAAKGVNIDVARNRFRLWLE